MSRQKTASIYWTFTIIGIIFACLLGFGLGYLVRDQFEPASPYDIGDQPNISQDIIEQQITDALSIVEPDATSSFKELYVYSGYVRSKTSSTLLVEYPDANTEYPDQLTFQLSKDTVYLETIAQRDANGLPGRDETELSYDDIAVGDIVTVYTNEDILTNDERTVNRVQRLTEAADSVINN